MMALFTCVAGDLWFYGRAQALLEKAIDAGDAIMGTVQDVSWTIANTTDPELDFRCKVARISYAQGKFLERLMASGVDVPRGHPATLDDRLADMEVLILRLLGDEAFEGAPQPAIGGVIGEARFVVGPVTKGIADALHREYEARSVELARRQGAHAAAGDRAAAVALLRNVAPDGEQGRGNGGRARPQGVRGGGARGARAGRAAPRAAHEIRATLSGITGSRGCWGGARWTTTSGGRCG
jgi:hypothetical protein